MTSEPTFDRRLRELMAELAVPGDTSPAIDTVLSRTGQLRPEPRWLALLKERPMRTQSITVAGSPPMRTGLILAVIAILVALLAGTVVVGASLTRGPTVPPAYGPARNGLIADASNGDIVVIDTAGNRTPITSGSSIDSMPRFSRDGTKVAFLRREPSQTESLLMVANADGSQLISVSQRLIDVQAFDWSPTGDRIALLGQRTSELGTGYPTPGVGITVFRTDGSDPTSPIEAMPDGVEPNEWVGWRPPGGDEILFRGVGAANGMTALYAVAASGGVPRALMESTGEEVTVADVELSPDGRWASFWNWGPNEAGEVNGWGRVLDLESGSIRIADDWGGSASPFTPDGRSVIGSGATWMIQPIDGSSPARAFGPAFDMGGVHAAISPDGTTLLVTTANGERTLLDIATGSVRPFDAASDEVLSWQRLALP